MGSMTRKDVGIATLCFIIVAASLFYSDEHVSPLIVPYHQQHSTRNRVLAVGADGIASSPKVVVTGWLNVKTGGPEALLQLLLAARKAFPNTYMAPNTAVTQNIGVGPLSEWAHPYYLKEYPGFENIPTIDTMQNLTSGDVLIIPESVPCPLDLVKRGVKVFNYVLSTNSPRNLVPECPQIAHNYYLTNHAPFEAKYLLRPYVTQSMVPPPQEWKAVAAPTTKERLVLLNFDSFKSQPKLVEHLTNQCKVKWNCKVVPVRGFDRAGLIDLFHRAMIVLDICMVGSERIILESSLYGVLPAAKDCACGKEPRDFPIPSRNIADNLALGDDRKEQLSLFDDIVPRMLDNYAREYSDYSEMRKLYAETIGPVSLEKEVAQFLQQVIPSSQTAIS